MNDDGVKSPGTTEALKDLLTDDMEDHGGIWSTAEYLPGPEPWSEAARTDPIHAVISASDESHEAVKSATDVEILLAHVNDGDLVIDMGCGYGRVAKYLLPHRVLSGYIGLDGSRVMLDLFRQRHDANPQESRTRLLLLHGRLDDIRLRSAVADVVVVSAVLLHNPKPVARRAIAEMHRVLKPGGLLLVLHDFPNRLSLAGLQGSAYLALMGRGRAATVNGPVRYYREKEVRDLLQAFGKVDVRFNDVQILPKLILGLPSWANARYRRILYQPVQSLAERLPPALKQRCYINLTAIATK